MKYSTQCTLEWIFKLASKFSTYTILYTHTLMLARIFFTSLLRLISSFDNSKMVNKNGSLQNINRK